MKTVIHAAIKRLIQVISEPIKQSALLVMVITNKEKLCEKSRLMAGMK